MTHSATICSVSGSQTGLQAAYRRQMLASAHRQPRPCPDSSMKKLPICSGLSGHARLLGRRTCRLHCHAVTCPPAWMSAMSVVEVLRSTMGFMNGRTCTGVASYCARALGWSVKSEDHGSDTPQSLFQAAARDVDQRRCTW